MDDVREIEDADEVGEVLLLDMREHRGANGPDEELVCAASEEGRVVERLDGDIVPLPAIDYSEIGKKETPTTSSSPVHGAKSRKRGLARPRVPGLYVGQDFKEDFIGQIVCVCGHGMLVWSKLCGEYRYPKSCRVEALRHETMENDVDFPSKLNSG